MAVEKEKTQRRVYVLPSDLVERITAFQADMGLQSEVEAVRRLLDEALKRRDDWRSITRRFLDRMKQTRVLSDIAGEVLMGHPLIERIEFGQDLLTFKLTTGEQIGIRKDGVLIAEDGDQNMMELDPKPRKARSDFGKKDDDEIPF